MRLTRVLFKKTYKGARKGQLRTPKDYQNPEKIQGVLTHTRGVELVPKVPKVTFGGGLENIYQGAVRRVIQLKTPWDVQKDLELEQVKSVNLQTLRNTPSYLNKEEERIYLSLLKSKTVAKEATEKKVSPLVAKLQALEGRNMEKTVWLMRRKDAPRESDLQRKFQPREIRADMTNIDEGLQENRGAYRPGDPQKPLI